MAQRPGSADFESLWSRTVAPLEPPNRRGDGTSEVGVVDPAAWPDLGAHPRLYVKRQRAFYCRPAWNAFRRTPTLRRELRFIRRARSLGVAVPDVVHYDEGASERALLILAEIPGVQDLALAVAGALPRERNTVFENVGKMLAKLHCAGILHGAIYPKHVLVEFAAPHMVWLIDFEKARRVMSPLKAATRDLARLLRHAPFVTAADLDSLLGGYPEPLRNRVRSHVAGYGDVQAKR